MAQQLARDEAGNVWDVSNPGSPRLVTPAQGGGQPSVVMPAAPADPKFVPDHPNLVYTPGKGVTALPGVPAPEPKPAPAPNFIPGKPGYVVTGPPNAPAATPIAGLPGAGVDIDASVRQKAIQQFNYAKQLEDTADQLVQLYNAGPGSTQGVQGLKDYLPSPTNKNFDAAANKSRGIVGQTLGFTGGQLNTPQEAEKAVGPFIPDSSDFDSTILQKIQSMRDLAASGRQNAIQTLGGIPDANGNITPAPATEPSAPPPTQQQQTALTDGKTRPVVDPVLQATGRRLGAMISQGVPDDKILQFLKDSGVDPANTNIQSVLHTRAADPKFKEWQRQNPGKAYPIGPQFYTKQVPVGGAEALLNAAALSPVGAFGASAANAMTGGYLDNMMQNPEQARTAMQLLRSQNPISSFAGDLTGYAADEALLGRIPGAQALMATKWGRRGADATYGAFSGSGENDDNRVMGALTGGLVNTGGGMFGRGLQRGAGAALTGIRNPALSYLDKAGIPLTVGRISRGAGDINPLQPSTVGDEVGKGVGGIEDRLMGLPGLDAVIGTARQRGDQAFNQAAFREIAPGVTGTGTDGLISAKAAETAAYSKLNPVQLSVDQPFTDSLSAAEQAAKGLSHHAGDVGTVINDIRQQIANGGMTGKGYQTAMQAIRKTRATLNDDVGGKASALLDGLEREVTALGSRQGGQIAQDLAEANAIHGRRKVMQAALRGGPAQGAGEMVSPKALNQASIGNTTRFGGLDKALSPDRPFYDLTSAGMKVMPNLTPDSGTAGRLLLYPLIAGAGGAGIGAVSGDNAANGAGDGASVGAGLGLLTLGAAAGPYSRTGQKIIQKALLGERPEVIAKIGDLLKRNPRFAGMFGAGAARDYVYQPELPAQ